MNSEKKLDIPQAQFEEVSRTEPIFAERRETMCSFGASQIHQVCFLDFRWSNISFEIEILNMLQQGQNKPLPFIIDTELNSFTDDQSDVQILQECFLHMAL